MDSSLGQYTVHADNLERTCPTTEGVLARIRCY